MTELHQNQQNSRWMLRDITNHLLPCERRIRLNNFAFNHRNHIPFWSHLSRSASSYVITTQHTKTSKARESISTSLFKIRELPVCCVNGRAVRVSIDAPKTIDANEKFTFHNDDDDERQRTRRAYFQHVWRSFIFRRCWLSIRLCLIKSPSRLVTFLLFSPCQHKNVKRDKQTVASTDTIIHPSPCSPKKSVPGIGLRATERASRKLPKNKHFSGIINIHEELTTCICRSAADLLWWIREA